MNTVSLTDKYSQRSPSVLVSGTQCLVRLLLMQRWRDQAAGLKTAAYVAGYRGSPLGGLDRELWRAKSLLDAHDIVFAPAINEELAATAIWGAQQSSAMPGARFQGVFGLWYGKGPGVDRAGDAFKHANLAGTARHGGVLAVLGDDHGAKSSSTAHQSEQAMVAAMMPILYPANVQEILAYGLYGWALSRYSGLWVGLKCVNETAEASAIIAGNPLSREILLPVEAAGGEDIHVHMRFEPEACERRLLESRLPRVASFVSANALDRAIHHGEKRRLAIVSAGKSHLDVCEALKRLGIDAHRARDLGVGLYKLAITWPIAAEGLRQFARDYQELLVVEEKRAFIEDQVATALYAMSPGSRPRIVGKYDDAGAPLLRQHGTLDVCTIAQSIYARLERLGMADDDMARRLAEMALAWQPERLPRQDLSRTPYFCPGCPHNSSTKVPDGSYAMAGIGCSYMAVYMERSTLAPTQMGGEGANWLGMAPFTETPHVFQNLGDGTYVHSGLLAIRAAVAAEVNITYKLLFNGTVAMTGGQPLEGHLTVRSAVAQLLAEGVRRIAIVTDDPGRYTNSAGFAAGVSIHHRRQLDSVQRDLRATRGTTILIYDQDCAAQKRRARTRGKVPPNPRRVFINSAVCEGCGDCSKQSNCVAILPRETWLGQKRAIDQSSCNGDLSCLEGFCPAFVSLRGAELRRLERPEGDDVADTHLPLPAIAPGECAALIAGIGGTGVVTVSALLAMAAHLDGKHCTVYDMTGLAQKNGTVMSHVRIAGQALDDRPCRLASAEATIVLACDPLVACSSESLGTMHGGTRVVANESVVPTGEFQVSGRVPPSLDTLLAPIAAIVGPGSIATLDASAAATTYLGNALFSNIIMLGFAWQQGLLPVSLEAVTEAIRLNGTAVEDNRAAFLLGRRLALNWPQSAPGAADSATVAATGDAEELTHALAAYRRELTAYQSTAYADELSAFVEAVAREEERRTGAARHFSIAVARSLFKLMAYKDEYEVARLQTGAPFANELARHFTGSYRVYHHFAPPALGQRKRSFGPWIRPTLRMLARMKWLRGTWLDPFGYGNDRRLERSLIARYRTLVSDLATKLSKDNLATARRIAELPLQMKGFGEIKKRNVERAMAEERALLSRLNGAA